MKIKYVFIILIFFPIFGNAQIEFDTINHTIDYESKKLKYLREGLLTELFLKENNNSLKINKKNNKKMYIFTEVVKHSVMSHTVY